MRFSGGGDVAARRVSKTLSMQRGDEGYKKLATTAKEKLGKSNGNTAKGMGKGKMGKNAKGGKGGAW